MFTKLTKHESFSMAYAYIGRKIHHSYTIFPLNTSQLLELHFITHLFNTHLYCILKLWNYYFSYQAKQSK